MNESVVELEAGIWAIVDRDYDQYFVNSVHPAEIDALRALNERGYGRVVFIPWGATLGDIKED